jgi:outer membrane protein OmpA-like peptidoglycan-associated protein
MYKLNPRYSILALILVSLVTLSGCATRKYVRQQLSGIDANITEVKTGLGETNMRVDQLSQRVETAVATANAADQKATAAAQAAGAATQTANNAERKADAANQSIQQMHGQLSAMEGRMGTPDSGYTAGDAEMVNFRNNSDGLDDKSKEKLDTVASAVMAQQPGGYMVEIQGFTDSKGSDSFNNNLSQRRAENVRRYLVGKGVPVYRIAVIGLGEERPVADNAVAAGREQNRRVEVRVFRSAAATRTTNQNQ